jgi:predicted GH43/DUF377 family glycosyl hydrolase
MLPAVHQRVLSRGDLPASLGGIYNPGAFRDGDEIALLCRREIDYRFTTLAFPEIVRLDPCSLIVRGHRTLWREGFPEHSRVEDFRPLVVEGRTLVEHTLVLPGRIKPVLSEIRHDALVLADPFDLPIAARPVEKNWVLFEHRSRLHCLYSLDPLTIFVRDGLPDGAASIWHLVKEEDTGWAADFRRTLSNSTNLVPFDNGYLGFWHSIVDDRYVQGAFLLDRDLSLAAKTGVLFDGAAVTRGYKRGVLYVSSAVVQHDRVLVFYGEADAHTSVAIVDREALSRALAASPFRAAPTLRVQFSADTLRDAFQALPRLEALSRDRGHPPIRLYVANARIAGAVQPLLRRNVLLRPGPAALDCHAVVSGGGVEVRTL